MKKKIFDDFYSPYEESDSETMDDWYKAYLEDEERLITKEGKTFSKIIHRCKFSIKPGYCLLVVFEPQEIIRIGDVLIDEAGHEFTISAFEMISFAGEHPDWYLKTAPVSIIGESYDIGDYLRKK
ncbi:MAG: hypothetical protein E7260_12195 [Lachnospiraceae bacterium]|nr:hypothetical protein [Lachnospiraceae bacterium]